MIELWSIWQYDMNINVDSYTVRFCFLYGKIMIQSSTIQSHANEHSKNQGPHLHSVLQATRAMWSQNRLVRDIEWAVWFMGIWFHPCWGFYRKEVFLGQNSSRYFDADQQLRVWNDCGR